MATLRVSNQAQLDAAVRTAGGGDTIMLASGTYAKLTMNGFNKGSKVTVTSADPGNPAVINSMLLKSSSNIEVKGVKLDYVPSNTGSTPFMIDGVRNVTINDVDLEGHVVSGYGSGIGLRVKGSQAVALLNSEVSNFKNGLSYSTNTNVTISNNDFRGMSTDAMQLGGLVQATIVGNDFRAMKSPAADRHKDMIQFVTGNGNAPSRDVVIRDNVIDNPEVSHGIFFGNAMARAGDKSAFYRNILIEDNFIRSAQVHGITMDHGSGVTIRDNTLVANGDMGYRADINIPLINVSKSSVSVAILNNTVASVPDGQGSWNISGNVTGSRDLQHWNGAGITAVASGSTTFSAAQASAPADDEPTVSLSLRAEEIDGGGKDPVRVSAGRAKEGDALVLDDIEFSEGDVIVFRDFDAGTFAGERGGNRLEVWNDAKFVEVDSLLDLQELVASSSRISAATAGDTLILRVAQEEGVAEITLEGLGHEFQAAHHEELF